LGVAEDWTERDVLTAEGRLLSTDAHPLSGQTYGRVAEVEALARAVSAKKSTVLLGPPGVGKTAVLRKLVQLVEKRAFVALEGLSVHEIATTGLVSGTRYTGMQEEKIASLLKHADPRRIVFVSDLWNITTAGSYDTNPRGIYDLMRPGIEAERLVLLGEMSQGRWDRLTREFPMLERDFATISVEPPSDDETRALLHRIASELAPDLVFERSAVERIFTLARKFLPTMSFPGKGVDLLRKVVQVHRGLGPEANPAPVDEATVERLFCEDTGLPTHVVSPISDVDYEATKSFLSERVLGQDDAVGAVSDVLALYKTGLANPDRPAGVFLLVGPTGVGKTELAKATAEFVFGSRERIFRVDLSEYKDFHSFERLIGDPKKGTPGLLTDHVRKHPFTVILLDEFEKGHDNIADLFLQVFDDARLTDAFGETVGFHHALLFLTSNVGSDVAAVDTSMGFVADRRPMGEILEERAKKSLEAHYRPEFLNRLDRVLVMKPLSLTDLRRIARRELGKVVRRDGLVERDLLLEVDDGVLELLVERGTDPKYGARPLKRAIEEIVMIPLARALMGTGWRRFQIVRVARKGGGIGVTFETTDASRRLENLERRERVSDGTGGILNLSVADIREKLAETFVEMGKLEKAANLAKMKDELADLDRRAATPAYWEAVLGDTSLIAKRHRLALEIRRLATLRSELGAVKDLAEASFLEADDSMAKELADAFARLQPRFLRARRELCKFEEVDNADAIVVVTPVGDDPQATEFARSLSDMYAAWARNAGYDQTQSEREGTFTVHILGPYAHGYLRGETGGHRLVLPQPERASSRRSESHLARVRVVPHGEDTQEELRLDDLDPIRTYDLRHSHGVRDRVTQHTEGDTKKVLAGRIGGFLEAHIDQR
jgi:ATP-dependent Clp protease ATP-binding subunit ClpC